MPDTSNPYLALTALAVAQRNLRALAKQRPTSMQSPPKRDRSRDAVPDTLAARNARARRLLESATERNAFNAAVQRNDDYFTYTPNGPAFTSTKR